MHVFQVLVILCAVRGLASPIRKRATVKSDMMGLFPEPRVEEIVDILVIDEVDYYDQDGVIISTSVNTKVTERTIFVDVTGPMSNLAKPTEPCQSSEARPGGTDTHTTPSVYSSFYLTSTPGTTTTATTPWASATLESIQISSTVPTTSTIPTIASTMEPTTVLSPIVISSSTPETSSSSKSLASFPSTFSFPVPSSAFIMVTTSLSTTSSSNSLASFSSTFSLMSPIPTATLTTKRTLSASQSFHGSASTATTTKPIATTEEPFSTSEPASISQSLSTSLASVASIPVPPPGALTVGFVDMDTDPDHFANISLYHHNVHRANHSAPAMVWNNTLFDWAKTKAKNCTFNEEMYPYMLGVGMNIAGGSYGSKKKSVPNPSSMISGLWYNSEVMNFPAYGTEVLNISDTETFNSWGHFSQLVWPSSIQLGCGVSDCGDQWFGACLYSPPGNMLDEWDEVGKPLGHPVVYPNGQTHM